MWQMQDAEIEPFFSSNNISKIQQLTSQLRLHPDMKYKILQGRTCMKLQIAKSPVQVQLCRSILQLCLQCKICSLHSIDTKLKSGMEEGRSSRFGIGLQYPRCDNMRIANLEGLRHLALPVYTTLNQHLASNEYLSDLLGYASVQKTKNESLRRTRKSRIIARLSHVTLCSLMQGEV